MTPFSDVINYLNRRYYVRCNLRQLGCATDLLNFSDIRR